jgi:hypothetical protein
MPKRVSSARRRGTSYSRQSRDSPRRPCSAADADQVGVARCRSHRPCPSRLCRDLVDAEVLGNPVHVQKAEDKQHDGYAADERKHE